MVEYKDFPSKLTVQRLTPLIGSLVGSVNQLNLLLAGKKTLTLFHGNGDTLVLENRMGLDWPQEPMCQCCTLLSKSTVNHRLGRD